MATPSNMDIAYAAHTASCTFLLDDEGICRHIVLKPRGKRREASRTAARCVGAQYVASLDGSAAGGLVEMPRVGASMLFARVDVRGRVSLVRTGIVTAFESQTNEDPFVDSQSVETSAPDLATPPAAPPRAQEYAPEYAQEYGQGEEDDEPPPDPDYYDPSDRTQRIQALRPEDIAAALGHDLATSEYHAAREADVPAPPGTRPPSDGAGATLRKPPRDVTVDELDDDDTYARPVLAPPQPAPSSRGMLPRRSDPHLRAAAARAHVPAPRSAPQADASDVQVSRRRRGG